MMLSLVCPDLWSNRVCKMGMEPSSRKQREGAQGPIQMLLSFVPENAVLLSSRGQPYPGGYVWMAWLKTSASKFNRGSVSLQRFSSACVWDLLSKGYPALLSGPSQRYSILIILLDRNKWGRDQYSHPGSSLPGQIWLENKFKVVENMTCSTPG